MCDEGKAKTDFARAVIERAMISGITPAQAAKELMEQRGEARMMAGSRKWGRQPSNALYGMETDESINANSFTSEAMNQQENLKNGIGYALYNGNYYLYDIDNDGMARPVENMGTSLEYAKKEIKEIRNGKRTTTGRVHNSNEQNRNGHDRSKYNLDDSSSEGKSYSESDKLAQREQGNRLQYDSEESGGNKEEGLELSSVQLMEGSDGTVYGWCEIERDAEGNVVARHIYLNDEVLNANTMVHELGHLWLNLLSEINPKLYEHGLGLAKQHPLFAELKASDEYGMLSDDEIADEVLARMIGDRVVRKQKTEPHSEFRFLF